MTPKETTAKAILDHVWPTVYENGTVDEFRNVRLTMSPFAFVLRTPFSWKQPKHQMSPTDYDDAADLQSNVPPLPYGMEIRLGDRVILSVEWSLDDEFDVLSFKRGLWETEILEIVEN